MPLSASRPSTFLRRPPSFPSALRTLRPKHAPRGSCSPSPNAAFPPTFRAAKMKAALFLMLPFCARLLAFHFLRQTGPAKLKQERLSALIPPGSAKTSDLLYFFRPPTLFMSSGPRPPPLRPLGADKLVLRPGVRETWLDILWPTKTRLVLRTTNIPPRCS